MASLNQCHFIGRLGRDPETRYTNNGDPVCNFSIACDWKTSGKEGVEWVRLVSFGKLAEICGKYLEKGSMVYVSGRMQTRKWEKDGATQYTTEIVAERMQMLGGKGEKKEAPSRNDGAPPNFDDMADDVPFAPLDWRLFQ